MFKRTTWVLLGLAVACLLGYFLLDNIQQLRQEQQAERARLFHFATDTIARIEIRQQKEGEPVRGSGAEYLEILLERNPEEEGSRWRIVSPIQSAALDFPIEQLLNTFSRLTPQITLEGVTDLAAFGLDQPRHQIALFPKEGDPYRLAIGNDNFDGSGFYAQPEGGQVVLLSSAQKGSLLPSLLALRDKTLLRFDTAEVKALQVQLAEAEPEVVRLQRQDVRASGAEHFTWQIVQPRELPADEINVNRLLNTLARLQAVEFPAETQTDLAPYGLEQPSARLTVELEGGKTLKVALGSEKDGQVYVITSEHPAVATLLTSTADILRSDLEELRDHRIARLNANQVGQVTLESQGEKVTLTPRPSEKGSLELRWENPERPGQPVDLGSLFSSLNAARAKEFVEQADAEAQRVLSEPDLRLTFEPKPDAEQDPLTLTLAASGLQAYVQSSRQPDIAVIELSTFNSLETEVNRLLEGQPESKDSAPLTQPPSTPSPPSS
ncbi:DUF4340 domain-containing protein [Synechococcus sp. R6-10]|uniref:DUF4340 domain-containing protein n=1 Tax=Synechococcus sp. R6-10 TaxID=2291956 RepID=UPI0039C1C266